MLATVIQPEGGATLVQVHPVKVGNQWLPAKQVRVPREVLQNVRPGQRIRLQKNGGEYVQKTRVQPHKRHPVAVSNPVGVVSSETHWSADVWPVSQDGVDLTAGVLCWDGRYYTNLKFLDHETLTAGTAVTVDREVLKLETPWEFTDPPLDYNRAELFKPAWPNSVGSGPPPESFFLDPEEFPIVGGLSDPRFVRMFVSPGGEGEGGPAQKIVDTVHGTNLIDIQTGNIILEGDTTTTETTLEVYVPATYYLWFEQDLGTNPPGVQKVEYFFSRVEWSPFSRPPNWEELPFDPWNQNWLRDATYLDDIPEGHVVEARATMVIVMAHLENGEDRWMYFFRFNSGQYEEIYSPFADPFRDDWGDSLGRAFFARLVEKPSSFPVETESSEPHRQYHPAVIADSPPFHVPYIQHVQDPPTYSSEGTYYKSPVVSGVQFVVQGRPQDDFGPEMQGTILRNGEPVIAAETYGSWALVRHPAGPGNLPERMMLYVLQESGLTLVEHLSNPLEIPMDAIPYGPTKVSSAMGHPHHPLNRLMFGVEGSPI
ncbi:hypothetical protein DC3_15560 [Deinococcus cellulosilyticus NBRC 106333 = KACC 11606]|uniref:Uncharacterized protein n=1 Tax=Deinococcus cellulosilyticus (strain DSM 18568 / NBRC 106333 / KACC 11606 / 5516J-15) TaxID=1223518 RepID=A0A511N081_DEIC1|nr:hypothetical protein DC3_15560 [Deinococcus cellulosilyticus NBRC 106333 = KACC 11606]